MWFSGRRSPFWQLPHSLGVPQISQSSNCVKRNLGEFVHCWWIAGHPVRRQTSYTWICSLEMSFLWSCILRNISSRSRFLLLSVIIRHLALISLERSIAVRFSLWYHIIVTDRRALIVSIAMWLWAATVMIVFLQVLKASIGDFEQLRARRWIRAVRPLKDPQVVTCLL